MALALALLVLSPSRGGATPPWLPPAATGEFYSEDGRFLLFVGNKDCAVYETAHRDVPVWSFQRESGFGTFLVAPDGQTVADLCLPQKGSELKNPINPCLRLWGPKGKIKIYLVSDLGVDVSRLGFRGSFLLGKWENWYSYAWADGDEFHVWVGDTQYTFSFQTGEVVGQEPIWQVRLRWAALPLSLAAAAVLLLVALGWRFRLWRRAAAFFTLPSTSTLGRRLLRGLACSAAGLCGASLGTALALMLAVVAASGNWPDAIQGLVCWAFPVCIGFGAVLACRLVFHWTGGRQPASDSLALGPPPSDGIRPGAPGQGAQWPSTDITREGQ